MRSAVTRHLFSFALIAGWLGVIGAASYVHATGGQVTVPAQQSSGVTASGGSARAVLDRYCVTCHNERMVRGGGEPASALTLMGQLRRTGLTLDSVDVTRPSANPDVWERVILKLRMGSMPPPGRPRPDQATYDGLRSWLETEIDRAAAESPNPGRNSTAHRLNRTEYQNAIRDLLAIEIDVTSLLPGDETSDAGFDNNADILSITTAQLERYLSAARKITRLATGLPPTGANFSRFRVPLLLEQDDRQSEDLPLGSRGGIAIPYYFPVEGEYVIKVDLRANWQDYIHGMGIPHQLDVRIDGALAKRFTIGGEAKGRPAPSTFTIAQYGDPEWEHYVQNADDGLEVRLPVQAGSHVVGVSFVRQLWEPEGILQPRQRGVVLSNDEFYDGDASVESVSIAGPHRITGLGDTRSRREIFVCQPRSTEYNERELGETWAMRMRADEEACATSILSRLARRAYRRPATAEDVETLLGFFESARATGGSFDAGIQLALERLLVDPDFLLRVERDPARVTPGQAYGLSQLEIASRLSFFLWSSIPDEPLLELAERGQLTDPAILEQQVHRMLKDGRASALVDDFASQWLHLRSLAEAEGDPLFFPDFDDNLAEAFRQETELFVRSTLREDRGVLDLLSADYTFVNERLARHYGIPGIYGNRFRRVTLPNMQQRGGLLGHGGLLMLTSYPTRTSPVLRGKWLLDAILGTPPPAPPANVPELPQRVDGRQVSVRERLEQHRESAVCASCHSTIDPLGFALENFDAIGAWRTIDTEGGKPIDATGTMPSGATVEGLTGLRALLLSRGDQFVHTVTEKLLAYALGRGLEYYDQPTVRKIVRDAAVADYRWSSLIVGIVKSPAFLTRRAAS